MSSIWTRSRATGSEGGGGGGGGGGGCSTTEVVVVIVAIVVKVVVVVVMVAGGVGEVVAGAVTDVEEDVTRALGGCRSTGGVVERTAVG
jgi:hypothetical protein